MVVEAAVLVYVEYGKLEGGGQLFVSRSWTRHGAAQRDLDHAVPEVGRGRETTYDVVYLVPLSLVQFGEVVPGRRAVRRKVVDIS